MRQFAVVLAGVTLWVAAASAQVDPKTAMLERTGWEALNRGDAAAAAAAFARAVPGDPANARVHFGAGVAAYLERRDADAALASC